MHHPAAGKFGSIWNIKSVEKNGKCDSRHSRRGLLHDSKLDQIVTLNATAAD